MIHRQFSFKMSKQKCADFLHTVAICGGCITCSFTTATNLPYESYKHCSMHTMIKFLTQDAADMFEQMITRKFGYGTSPPENVHTNSEPISVFSDQDKDDLEYRIEVEGFDYAFLYYSQWSQIGDEGFQQRLKAFKDSRKELEKYLKDNGVNTEF